MNITIDCRLIDSSGVGIYLSECLPYFFETDNTFFLIGNIEILNKYLAKNNKIKLLECRIKPFSIVELFFFPKKLLKKINSSDLYFNPFFNIPSGIKIPIYSTIHDIIFPDMPELTSRIGLEARMFFYRRCFKLSKTIFTVSEFSKSRIKHFLGNEKSIIVTYSGIKEKYIDLHINTKNIKKKDTIIFIGNIKKHKGLHHLLEAFLLAKNEGIPHILVVVGDNKNLRTYDNEFLNKLNSINPKTVVFTGFITEEKLIEYISTSSLLVQPSLYEGFCLPPLEALALGTPALISDIPVLKEIYSDFPVVFFKSGDPLDLKNEMIKIINNNIKITLPDYLLNKYTFQKISKKIMEVFSNT